MKNAFRRLALPVWLPVGIAAFGNVAAAQELGERVPDLQIAYYAADMGPMYEQSARVLSEEWSKLGLTFRMQPVQFSTFISNIMVGGGLEDMAVFTVGADPDRVDPTYWLHDLGACGARRNGAKWCDEAYSAKVREQREMVDQTQRIAAVKQAQQHFYDTMPWWPATNTVYGMVWNSDKWENVTSPAPVAAHEGLIDPWLSAKPKTDDRWFDWAHYEDVTTYNPLAEEGAVGWLRFVYDTFAKNNSKGETIPWAAASWEFTEPTNVKITLRQGMTFHDGEAVTADDAVFTINKVVELQPPAMSSRIANLAGAEKVDDLTFNIKLKTPDASFVTTVLPYAFILPEHLWANYEGDMVARDVVADGVAIGSGPFRFKTWRINEIHELETFKEHFQAPGYDGVRRLALGQADAIRSAMLSGTGDIATMVLPVAAMSDLATQNNHLDFLEIPSHGSMLVWLNNQKAPFTDPAFRKAMRVATSKERAAVEGWLGFAVPAGEGPVPKQLGMWYNADLPEITFDIEAARAALEQAGYGWDAQGRLHYPKK
ncbi:ABC transporter substrate-binding protein [Aminobacter aganoensis]|uniref:Peptide/nickel transport system substrate-binding protein n=1 Tax=Aminobacter aganoensis TaxID=83264 RepID=A0A7X0F3M9_9HYPH|nr:ABC transporter substrate-binding protein [Aminobacter aganoensis]MBB6352472.1 peptide/nickel transport system substrate-binding protein [Aminobacter aganoensis]